MAPRLATIKATIDKALMQIEKDKCGSAEKTLDALSKKLSGTKRPSKPNKFALFVRQNYSRISKANPSKDAPGVMKLIAKEWQAKK